VRTELDGKDHHTSNMEEKRDPGPISKLRGDLIVQMEEGFRDERFIANSESLGDRGSRPEKLLVPNGSTRFFRGKSEEEEVKRGKKRRIRINNLDPFKDY